MIAWLFAQLPQIVKNYQQGSVESLAPTFLLSWMAGDATNLLGCILTDQLVFQVCALLQSVNIADMHAFADLSSYLVSRLIRRRKQR